MPFHVGLSECSQSVTAGSPRGSDLRETASELGWGALGDDPAGPPLDEDGEMAAR